MQRLALLVVAACAKPAPAAAPPAVAAAPPPAPAQVPPPPDAMSVDAGPTPDWYCVNTNGKGSVCGESLDDCKEEIEENNLRDHHCTHESAAYCLYLDYSNGEVGRQCMRTHEQCMALLQPALEHSDLIAPEDRSCEREPGR